MFIALVWNQKQREKKLGNFLSNRNVDAWEYLYKMINDGRKGEYEDIYWVLVDLKVCDEAYLTQKPKLNPSNNYNHSQPNAGKAKPVKVNNKLCISPCYVQKT